MITSTPFAVSVYQETWQDFDTAKHSLVQHILELERTEPSVYRSNNGGYQTQPTLGGIPEFRPLLEFIANTAQPVLESYNIPFNNIVIDSAWGNVNRGTGSHNQQHIHDGILSGVFYLQAPSGSGRLNIRNPGMTVLWQGHLQSNQHNQHTADVVQIIPKEGELFLWPSYVPHSVDTNIQDDCERISISFNIHVS